MRAATSTVKVFIDPGILMSGSAKPHPMSFRAYFSWSILGVNRSRTFQNTWPYIFITAGSLPSLSLKSTNVMDVISTKVVDFVPKKYKSHGLYSKCKSSVGCLYITGPSSLFCTTASLNLSVLSRSSTSSCSLMWHQFNQTAAHEYKPGRET